MKSCQGNVVEYKVDFILDCFWWLHYLTTFCCTQQSVYVICSGDGWFFSPYRRGGHIWKQSTMIALDVRRTQHIILRFLWYSVGIPVVLKCDLLWYSFRGTSPFSAPSWIIYFVGTKMLNKIKFVLRSKQWLRGAMDNALPLQRRCWSQVWLLQGVSFLYFIVVLFCFVLFL